MYIKFEDVSHHYHSGTPMAQRVLHNINLSIAKASFNCIIGHTGSGKSTLMQHLNALLLPSTGTIKVPGGTISAGWKTIPREIKQIRQNVGLVFQFPEYQLFETTVLKDIMFGPKNYGKSSKEAEVAARKAAEIVGLEAALLEKSPFELSGGQMRRVAIAGILAMNPDVVVLDEPTAGLDPRGQKEILEIVVALQKQGKTVIVTTHDMDLVAKYANHVMVMCEGRKLLEGTPNEVFAQPEVIKKAGIYLPTAADIYAQAFEHEGALPLTLDEFVEKVVEKKCIASQLLDDKRKI
jgi:energy-coupling factor transport system ATP-binding protein